MNRDISVKEENKFGVVQDYIKSLDVEGVQRALDNITEDKDKKFTKKDINDLLDYIVDVVLQMSKPLETSDSKNSIYEKRFQINNAITRFAEEHGVAIGKRELLIQTSEIANSYIKNKQYDYLCRVLDHITNDTTDIDTKVHFKFQIMYVAVKGLLDDQATLKVLESITKDEAKKFNEDYISDILSWINKFSEQHNTSELKDKNKKHKIKTDVLYFANKHDIKITTTTLLKHAIEPAEYYVKQRRYDDLSKELDHITNDTTIDIDTKALLKSKIIFTAMKLQDSKAVQQVLESITKDEAEKYKEDAEKGADKLTYGHNITAYNDVLASIDSNIIAFKQQWGIKISAQNIYLIAALKTPEEFEQLIYKWKIDLDKIELSKVQKYYIPYLRLQKSSPAIPVNNENGKNIADILLSRTYYDNLLPGTEISTIYNDLQSCEESKKVLEIMATLIRHDHDPVKIIFGDHMAILDLTNLLQRAIYIAKPMEVFGITRESAVAHEFTHYILGRRSSSNTMNPIEQTFTTDAMDFYRKYIYAEEFNIYDLIKYHKDQGREQVAESLSKYSSAIFDMLIPVYDLLSPSHPQDISNDIHEIIKRIKDCPVYNMLALSQNALFSFEMDSKEKIADEKEQIANELARQLCQCGISPNDKKLSLKVKVDEIKKETKVDGIQEKIFDFIKTIQDAYELKEGQMIFLKRSINFIDRAASMLDEAIVRCVEYAVLDHQGKFNDERITESLVKMKKFLNEEVFSKYETQEFETQHDNTSEQEIHAGCIGQASNEGIYELSSGDF